MKVILAAAVAVLPEPVKLLLKRARLLARLPYETRLKRSYLAQNSLKKLHLGCGNHIIPGWLNTDFYPGFPGVCHLDASKRFPFQDATFDRAFSEHMIEHIPLQAGLRMLSECHRVLKPGGRIRISTPNLAFLVSLYQNGSSELESSYVRWASDAIDPRPPYSGSVFVINNFVRCWGHQFIYDRETLAECLDRAGFRDVSERRLNQSKDPDFANLENETRMPPRFLQMESITLEAEKA